MLGDDAGREGAAFPEVGRCPRYILAVLLVLATGCRIIPFVPRLCPERRWPPQAARRVGR